MYKLVVLGKDGLIHCCNVNNKSRSCCEDDIPVVQVNPNFNKLTEILWCWECSHLLEKQDEDLC